MLTSDKSHAGSAGKQYRPIGDDKRSANNDTSARQCSSPEGGISMLWVGMDTHYGLYDPGYREKSLGMDTVGNSASTLYQQISSFLLFPSGPREIGGSQTTTK